MTDLVVHVIIKQTNWFILWGRQNEKQILSIALAFALLFTQASAVAWPTWAEAGRAWGEQHALSDQYLNQPNHTLSRIEVAQLLYEVAQKPAVTAPLPFSDVSEKYSDAATWVATTGLMQGVGQNLFLPNRALTRQEFATILYRDADSPLISGTLTAYIDANSVAEWAYNAMVWSVESGLIQGRQGNVLAPNGTITVAEALLILQRQSGTTPIQPETPMVVTSKDDLQAQLLQAIKTTSQPPLFDVSGLQPEYGWEIDIQNIYYTILSAYPEYKYAYHLETQVKESGLLQCNFSYMPYRTGLYPENFSGITVSSLTDLMLVASSHLSETSVNIRITDPSLTVDHMNKILQQVGGSYFLCQLNKDGTAITITPLNGMTTEAASNRLTEINQLVEEIYLSQTTDSQTDRERALSLYTWLTDNVRYDQRYYSDPSVMPYDSTTAYGALHDHLAICGGYAQALQSLFLRAGIPCFTISGTWGRESHMWNLAYLDGNWHWFDATSDRGCSAFGFSRFDVSDDQMTSYSWDHDWANVLIQAAS